MNTETIFWYQLDPDQRAGIAARYQGVPLDHINLDKRPRNALVRHDPGMDVAALLLADESIRNVDQLGVGALAQINERMLALLDGSVPLEVAVPPADATTATGNLSSLPEQAAQLPIGVLHLPVRTYNALAGAGIATVGQLAHTPEQELAAIKGVSVATIAEAKERTAILFSAVWQDGAVDWAAFCQALAIPLIPPAVTSTMSVRALVRLLPKLVVQAMAHEENTHLQDVAEQRFLYGNRRRPTLEDVARGLDMTRERVRQLEAKVLDFIRAALVDNNYTARPFHIHPDVAAAFAALWRHTQEFAATPIIEGVFDQSLLDKFELHKNDLQGIKSLLLDMAEIERLSFGDDSLSPVLYRKPFPFAFDPAAVLPLIHEVLFRSADAMTLSSILMEVNRRLGTGNTISREALRAAIGLCSSVEEVEAGLFRCRFEALCTRADQFERVLIEQGEPMAVTDIWRVMNQRLLLHGEQPLTERNVANQLVTNGDRFEPIGRSGRWALKSWGLETESILTLMRQFLMKQNRPCSRAEITTYVLERRPASENSIVSYLASRKEFVKLDGDLWGLEAWGLASQAAATTRGPRTRTTQTLRDKMGDDCRAVLNETPGKQMQLQELIERLRQRSSEYDTTSYHTFHSYITKLPFVECYQPPGSRKLVVRLKDAVRAALADRIQTIQSQAVRAEVERATFYLNEDTVDVGLFLLSKQFEVVLKQYVETGDAAGAFSNQAPNDKKLVNLIAFVAKEKIVEDRPALEYLRQARNERAHGATPSLEQRRLMMNQVVADAGKYIDYIKFFDDKIGSLA